MPTPDNNPNRRPASYSGPPEAFSHVKLLRPGFAEAATGEREKKQVRAKAPQVKKAFGAAHEGPREKVAEPKKQHVILPQGARVQAVHTRVEREKIERNRQRDLQMKQWRERKVPQPTRPARPQVDLKKKTPDVRLAAEKKRSVKEALKANRSQGRGHRR